MKKVGYIYMKFIGIEGLNNEKVPILPKIQPPL
jgi:hypothetical protein